MKFSELKKVLINKYDWVKEHTWFEKTTCKPLIEQIIEVVEDESNNRIAEIEFHHKNEINDKNDVIAKLKATIEEKNKIIKDRDGSLVKLNKKYQESLILIEKLTKEVDNLRHFKMINDAEIIHSTEYAMGLKNDLNRKDEEINKLNIVLKDWMDKFDSTVKSMQGQNERTYEKDIHQLTVKVKELEQELEATHSKLKGQYNAWKEISNEILSRINSPNSQDYRFGLQKALKIINETGMQIYDPTKYEGKEYTPESYKTLKQRHHEEIMMYEDRIKELENERPLNKEQLNYIGNKQIADQKEIDILKQSLRSCEGQLLQSNNHIIQLRNRIKAYERHIADHMIPSPIICKQSVKNGHQFYHIEVQEYYLDKETKTPQNYKQVTSYYGTELCAWSVFISMLDIR